MENKADASVNGSVYCYSIDWVCSAILRCAFNLFVFEFGNICYGFR